MTAIDQAPQDHRYDVAARLLGKDRAGAIAHILALGLPADALLADLHGRADQLLEILDGSRNRWRQHPLIGMAEQMEALARQMRDAGQALSKEAADA